MWKAVHTSPDIITGLHQHRADFFVVSLEASLLPTGVQVIVEKALSRTSGLDSFQRLQKSDLNLSFAWCIPVVPATWEVEAGGLLQLRRP